VHSSLSFDLTVTSLLAPLVKGSAVVLVGADEGVTALGETLRQKVSEHLFVFQDDSIRVTISIGAALLQDSDRGANDLIKRADEKLYQAKNTGRNRVCA